MRKILSSLSLALVLSGVVSCGKKTDFDFNPPVAFSYQSGICLLRNESDVKRLDLNFRSPNPEAEYVSNNVLAINDGKREMDYDVNKGEFLGYNGDLIRNSNSKSHERDVDSAKNLLKRLGMDPCGVDVTSSGKIYFSYTQEFLPKSDDDIADISGIYAITPGKNEIETIFREERKIWKTTPTGKEYQIKTTYWDVKVSPNGNNLAFTKVAGTMDVPEEVYLLNFQTREVLKLSPSYQGIELKWINNKVLTYEHLVKDWRIYAGLPFEGRPSLTKLVFYDVETKKSFEIDGHHLTSNNLK